MINTLGSTLRFGYDMRASLNNHTFTVDIRSRVVAVGVSIYTITQITA